MRRGEIVFEIRHLRSCIGIPGGDGLLERLRLGNCVFQVGLQVAGICLALFGDLLQKAAVDVIHIDPGNGINIGDLKWIHFIVIDRKDRLLVTLDRFHRVRRYDNHKICLIERQFCERQFFITFHVLIGDGGTCRTCKQFHIPLENTGIFSDKGRSQGAVLLRVSQAKQKHDQKRTKNQGQDETRLTQNLCKFLADKGGDSNQELS